jgi:uncharacterized SAM-binding protein YcdF (DUF218 family)
VFFVLSKLFWFLAAPSNLLPLLGLLGLLVGLRRPRLGGAVAALALSGLVVAGMSPLAGWVARPLEDRFPAYVDDGGPIAGVIVLGGASDAPESLRRGQLLVNDAGDRLIALGDLARRLPAARLVFSGGPGSLGDPNSESTGVQRFEGTLGIEAGRVAFEGASRNTRENAVFTAAMVPPKAGERWLLVTSAFHMPRAMGCFRAVGYDVVAYPVDYRDTGPSAAVRLTSDSLALLDLVAKEWVGLVAYRLAGYTDALWPRP